MEKEVALALLRCFLEKRGVGPLKDLAELITMGKAKGFFTDPEKMFEVEEWRAFRDCLWDLVIDDDKAAKELMKSWREVTNCVKRYQEERLAAAVTSRLASADPNAGKIMLCENHIPIPPLSQTVVSVPPIEPTVPPIDPSCPPPPPPPSGTVASGGQRAGTHLTKVLLRKKIAVGSQ